MKGLEICRAYYETYGAPMLRDSFPELEGVLAIGLVGAGSECCGYDDEVSRDHDFEPGFCIFLPGEDLVDSRAEFRLERAYAKLPKEFMGVRRLLFPPAGGARKGVLRISDFYSSKTGHPDGRLTLGEWLSIPEQYLLEATNGAIFRDDSGLFSGIRARLSEMPADVRKKKLAGRLYLAAQAGVYNYPRCLAHGETGGAQLALSEFAKHAIAAAFLINGRYLPFYKWQFRALRTLPRLSETAGPLEMLLTTPNDAPLIGRKAAAVGEICRALERDTREARLAATDLQERRAAHPFEIAREADGEAERFGSPYKNKEENPLESGAERREGAVKDFAGEGAEHAPGRDVPDLSSLAFAVNEAIADGALRAADLTCAVDQ